MKLPYLKYTPKELLNFKGSSRSEKAKKNIILLFILNFFNFIAIMALVPVSIGYLGEVEYGIWLTLHSILMWLVNLDFGLGNGLRNKLAEAFAHKDIKLARSYVSTAYAIFSTGLLFVIIIYLIIHPFINWTVLLNAPQEYFYSLNKLVLFVFVLFCIHFLLRLLSSIINADQKPAINGVISLSINGLTLLAVIGLSHFYDKSLLSYGVLAGFIPVLVFLTGSVIMFLKMYKSIAPGFKFVNLKYSSALIKLGMQFFIIQIAGLIIFTTGNIIITQLFGPASVTVYNVAYKYFYLAPMVFNVIIAPFWSAFTEAYVKQEYDWIKSMMRKLVLIWAGLSSVVVLMIIFSDLAYALWVGKEIEVPFLLSVLTGLFVIIANWNNIFVYFINGVGKVRLQFYYSIITAIVNIPLSIFLAKNLNMGISGVMLSTIICLTSGSIWAPIQYLKIINNKATGIWNK
ncbi:MAG: MATE family efflux transporter [Ignavibacteriaceae bacterium]|nr:MATE family efflux transporter [Ignavibacteriaceae bacterium]